MRILQASYQMKLFPIAAITKIFGYLQIFLIFSSFFFIVFLHKNLYIVSFIFLAMAKNTAKVAKGSQPLKPLFTMTCKDLGSVDCRFSVTTHSTDEVKKALWAHARYAHPDIMQKMSEAEKQGMAMKMDEMVMKQSK